jgi:hypothetical protein
VAVPELIKRIFPLFSTLLLLASTAAQSSGFVAPVNLDPTQSGTPVLDSSFNQEAWLVYGYNIDIHGAVVDMQIYRSNGVAAVEQKTRDHIDSLKFKPATRDGRPVTASVGPIVFTWILDNPRVMTDEFEARYKTAWALFKREEYDDASKITATLRKTPGRNAFEETKVHILAASLASRRQDRSAELRELKQILVFQTLAEKNHFANPYIEEGQYLLILERIHALQLELNMLADAQATFSSLENRAADSEVTARAQITQQQAVVSSSKKPDITIAAELNAVYSGGRGYWETRLSRDTFYISDVKGSIQSLYLSCKSGKEQRLQHSSLDLWTIPAGWSNCKMEAAGKSGTRFVLHQPKASAESGSTITAPHGQ